MSNTVAALLALGGGIVVGLLTFAKKRWDELIQRKKKQEQFAELLCEAAAQYRMQSGMSDFHQQDIFDVNGWWHRCYEDTIAYRMIRNFLISEGAEIPLRALLPLRSDHGDAHAMMLVHLHHGIGTSRQDVQQAVKIVQRRYRRWQDSVDD